MKASDLLQYFLFVLVYLVLSTSGERKIARACDGHEIELKCDPNEYIKVRSVFFGRTEKNFCNPNSDINLVHYANCRFSNETHALKSTVEKCDNRTTCVFNATSTFYGGNCPKKVGYLEVVFDCKKMVTLKAVKCEGRNMTLTCPKDFEIEIVDAMYGRLEKDNICLEMEDIPSNCVSPITLDVVSTMCNGKKECGIPAVNSIFGNPCPFSRNYLSVAYQCRPIATRREVVCEGDGLVVLKCPPGKLINLIRVDYGRKSPYDCSGGVVAVKQKKKGDRRKEQKCSTPFGSEISKMRCNGREMCTIKADNVFFGDPCPGVTKYVEAIYECQAIPSRKEVACLTDGNKFEITCPENLNIQVSSAYYGRLNQGICHDDNTVDHVCYSPQSEAIVGSMCNGRNSCKSQLTRTFGMPCPESSSYLEVNYVCMKNEHLTSLACEGENLLISCPAGYYIEIEDALFGRGDDFFCPYGPIKHTLCHTPVVSLVKEICNSQRICSIPASSDLYGKPCGNTTSYLEVKYSCLKWDTMSGYACDGDEMHISCPDDTRIKILDANYGRRESNLCLVDEPLLHPKFVSSCYSQTSRRVVEESCSAFHNCTLLVDEQTFGDPCPNTPKYLDVTYACINYINN